MTSQRKKGNRMFFARHKWMLVTVAIIVGVLLVTMAWSVVYLTQQLSAGLINEKFTLEVTFMCVGFGLAMLGMITMYIGWLQKYYNFFKLHRLLEIKTAGGKQFEVMGSDGIHYVVTGKRPRYQIVTDFQDGVSKGVIDIDGDYLSMKITTSRTEVNATDAHISEREHITTTPVFVLSQGATFKRLCKVLESSKS